jgi:uncharacterized protein (TIGR03435 family)
MPKHFPYRLFICFLLAAAASLPAQTPPARLTFDVAAIHPSKPGLRAGSIRPMPNGTGYLVQNMPIRILMSLMYRIPTRQIEGQPGWFDSEPFDIEARAEGVYGIDDLHTMFKNLLADRFGLKFHIDTRQGPVYALTIDKSGLKMTPQGSTPDLNIPVIPRGPGDFVGAKVPMPYLCWFLGQIIQNDPRPVIDRTGLAQVYGFTLKFSPDLPLGVSGNGLLPDAQQLPALRDALIEQLGLRLVPMKGPVDYYVIDQVSRPTEN